MSTSAYYSFIATDKPAGEAHSIDNSRQAAASPASFATSSSTSSSSLNQFASLTPTSSANSTTSSAHEAPISSSSSSASSTSSSCTNSTSHVIGQPFGNVQRRNNLDFRRQSSITPTLSQQHYCHSPSQLFHSYTLHSLEPKPLKPFKTNSDYIEAMKEDLAEWFNQLYSDLELTPENFFSQLETGSIICRHANNVTLMGRNHMTDQANQPLQNTTLDSLNDGNGGIEPNNNSITTTQNDSSICSSTKSSQQSSPLSNSFSTKFSDRAINWFQIKTIPFKQNAQPGTFFARDNICQFIIWCRSLNILDCLLFETDDLVARKNAKSFILCLLEVARIGFKVGMPTPLIIQLEQEIDREIENDARLQTELEARKNQDHTIDSYGENELCHGVDAIPDDIPTQDETVNEKRVLDEEERTSQDEEVKEVEVTEREDKEEEQDYGPKPQVITNDLLSLHERVVQLLCQCTCPTQFPMVRVGDNGKYKVGDKLIIFVRILRRHIMVRVGGGWQELSEFLRVKDPCRTKTFQAHPLHNQNGHHHHHLQQAQQLNNSARFVPNINNPLNTARSSRFLESSLHLNKGANNQSYRATNGQRLISGSASMSWLSHNA